ncbi:MAG: Ig-like domain-containing protein [Candidatus Micrarchaeota archaeon]|nr:Ig-like domain-containing protein [Candidatus Micrarchaeota archaeon]
MRNENNAQAAMEYMVTFGWAILILGIVMGVLYLYLYAPQKIVGDTCNFLSSIYCNEVIVGTNTISHNTVIALFLTNSQQYPITNPEIYARVNSANTTAVPCSPSFVLQGGSMICTLSLNSYVSIGELSSGDLYLNATYCGLSTSPKSCSNGEKQTYSGSFAAHAQPIVTTRYSIKLTALNYTQKASGQGDQLTAYVTLLGYPLKGATVNFTESNGNYVLSRNTTTNSNGIAIGSIYGTAAGNVIVTAHYAGLSNSIAISFV